MKRGKAAELPPFSPKDGQELARLSGREREVLGLAASGYLDKQIAAVLDITPNTLRTYWTRIRGKLGDGSRGSLIALYVSNEAVKATALNPIEGASWHIDIARNVLVFYGDRGLFPRGEISLEEAFERYHPQDREKVQALFRALTEREMPPFTFAARIVTPNGVETASAYVEAVRDGTGRLIRIVGRHVPLLYLPTSEVQVGSYRRNLRTSEVTADEGFRSIFRLREDEPNLLEAIYAQICPEYHEATRAVVGEMLAGKERSRLLTLRLCHGEGDVWVSSQVRLEYEDDVPVVSLVTVLAYR